MSSGVQHGGGGGGEARCRAAGNHNARGPVHVAGGEKANDKSRGRETGRRLLPSTPPRLSGKPAEQGEQQRRFRRHAQVP